MPQTGKSQKSHAPNHRRPLIISGNLALGLGLVLSSLLPNIATAQVVQREPTYNMGYGNGYDPLQGAISVLNGTSSVTQSGQQNYQNSVSQQNSITNSQNLNGADTSSNSDDAQAKAAQAAQQKMQDDAIQAGFGKLSDSTQSIMPTTKTDDNKKKTTEKFSDPEDQDLNKYDPTQDMTPEQKKKHEEVLKALNGQAGIKDTTEKTVKQEQTVAKDEMVSGKATALDGVTLSVNGSHVVLAGIKGPGNGQLCYHDGVPWQCGDYARTELQNIVSGAKVTCDVSGGIGYCSMDDGSNVAEAAAERGYVIGTVEQTKNRTRIAIENHTGLFQK